MLADFASAFSGVITKDGQTTTSAAIPFGTLGILTDKVNESTTAKGVAVKGTTADPVTNAAAGYVGEVMTSTVVSGSAVSLTDNTAKTVTSISLTAGDWDVFGAVAVTPSVGCTTLIGGSSLVTDTNGAEDGNVSINGTFGAGALSFAFPTVRVSIASTTTVYLVARSAFASGTNGGWGRITARRVR